MVKTGRSYQLILCHVNCIQSTCSVLFLLYVSILALLHKEVTQQNVPLSCINKLTSLEENIRTREQCLSYVG